MVVPMLSKLDAYQTLLDPFKEIDPQKPFVTMWRPDAQPEFETASFGEHLNLAQKIATIYADCGLEPGDRVILIMPQGISLMAAFTAAMLKGAVPTILAYPNFKIDPHKYQTGLQGVTRNIGARLIVLDRDFPAHLQEHVSAESARLVQWNPDDLRNAAPAPPDHRPQPSDIAFLQHSAGTTGLQKGVALSHRVVLSQLKKLASALKLSQEDRIVSWLPLYHDMGLIACFILPLTAGLHVVMQSPVDWVMRPGSFLRLIERYRCTLSWIPNFTFQFLARRVSAEERQAADLSSMRAFVTTSEPIRAHSMDEFRRAYRDCGLGENALQTSYGMAENVFAATNSRMDRPPRRIWVDRTRLRADGEVVQTPPDHPAALAFVSCGQCMDGVEAEVVDEDGRQLPEGRMGELTIRSDCLFDGYFNRPDLTREALREGCYWTGDVGFILGEDVFVMGRKDDTVIVGGRNLYPQDVEEIAFAHPDVHDGRAVAFGLENPDLGTEDLVVVAEVHTPDRLARRQRIAAEIRRDVVAQMDVSPRAVHVVGPKWLIKSTAGKPARSANREKFLRECPQFARRPER